MVHIEAVSRNLIRMRDDLGELLANKPSFERLLARVHVARALESCDYEFMAFPEEIVEFDSAIRLDPQYARAYTYRAIAISSYYRRQPDHVEIHMNSAISDCIKAIELAPNGKCIQGAYSLLSAEYEHVQKDFQKAIDVCSTEISYSTEGLNHQYRHRASLYRKLGNNVQAMHDENIARSFDKSQQWHENWCGLSYQWSLVEQLLLLLVPVWFLWTIDRLGRSARPAP